MTVMYENSSKYKETKIKFVLVQVVVVFYLLLKLNNDLYYSHYRKQKKRKFSLSSIREKVKIKSLAIINNYL